MTYEQVEARGWSRRRWWTFIGVVFVGQLALILWLGRPQRIVRAPKDVSPMLRLAGRDATNVLALTDPTLFVLPHIEGFSGLAWLTVPEQEYRPTEWSEPEHWLALAQEKLGARFNEFISTNTPDQLQVFAQPEFRFKQPVVLEPAAFPTQSLLRLTGGLADRKLLVAPALPSWTNAEILTNSVVQIMVGADGKPVSTPTLLKPPGSGGPNEADLFALREARKAQFEPLNVPDPSDPLAGLTVGQFIFEWHTLPLPVTNTPSENPPAGR